MNSITAVPLQPGIGAEIRGIDLRHDISRHDRDFIYETLLAYKVVFFRNQDITREQHIAFASVFGELQKPLQSHPDYPQIRIVESTGQDGRTADVWHTDYSDRPEPPLGSILRAVVLPSLGGDTIFADAIAAYENLDDALKERIEGRRAVHDLLTHGYKYGLSPEQEDEARRLNPPTSQPIVSVHPDTGRRALFVNKQFTHHIEDMDKEEGDALLEVLYRYFERPEHQVRFAWRPHSLAFWDNRGCQHYGVANFFEPRRLERIDLGGQRVFAVGDRLDPYKLPAIVDETENCQHFGSG